MTVLQPLLVVSALFRLQGRGGSVLGVWIARFLIKAVVAGGFPLSRERRGYWGAGTLRGGERLDSVRVPGRAACARRGWRMSRAPVP